LRELREAGFRTVEVQWQEGWTIGSSENEGQARLACRPATVMRYVYDELHAADPALGFCATGNSGGAAQIAYALSQYGLGDIVSLAVPTGGPPMTRIDLGCIRDHPANQPLWFVEANLARIDEGYGYPAGVPGPCAAGAESFRGRFEEASIGVGPWQYLFPRTLVWFLFGESDDSVAVPQGLLFYERLVHELPRNPTNIGMVRMGVVPDTGHGVSKTRIGANTVRDVLLGECRPR
jgi:hypothetical protein